jgi:beta-lactamase class D
MLVTGLSAALQLQADTPYWPRPLSDYAGDTSACIAVYSKAAGEFLVHNMEQCQQRLSPCSTFKIPNALIGLETRVLSGPDDTKSWDGTEHSREILNQDHDLSSAIRYSVVWYFQDVALDISAERMQTALDSFDYGNRDISGGQDRFWLASSLKISALEQITFLAALDDGQLPASKENQALVKTMILQDDQLPETFSGKLYGKTGSCIGPAGDHGWFAGFLHRDGQQYVFAVNIKGDHQGAREARAMAIQVLQEMR